MLQKLNKEDYQQFKIYWLVILLNIMSKILKFMMTYRISYMTEIY